MMAEIDTGYLLKDFFSLIYAIDKIFLASLSGSQNNFYDRLKELPIPYIKR